ncbi:MAG: hypothetical protein LIO74_10330 [Ruminococcus sp.]|nr:hypothetical protein [Ruminococcus sp.]
MKSKDSTTREHTLRNRILALLTTLLLIVGCIPAGFSFQSFTAAARAGSSNSMVLTNASVKFRDSSYKEITSIQSGTTFYIF